MAQSNQQQFIRIGAVVIAIDTVASIKFRGFGEADVILRNGREFRIRGISKTQRQAVLDNFTAINNAIRNN